MANFRSQWSSLSPARHEMQSSRGRPGRHFNRCFSSMNLSWTVQPVGWSADLTSLCFRFGACLYTILTGRFDFLTILLTSLSKWSEQNGRLNVTLSELLSVSLVREAGSLFAFSRASSIVSLGKPFCWSKASILLSLRCRAIDNLPLF